MADSHKRKQPEGHRIGDSPDSTPPPPEKKPSSGSSALVKRQGAAPGATAGAPSMMNRNEVVQALNRTSVDAEAEARRTNESMNSKLCQLLELLDVYEKQKTKESKKERTGG